jgi:hypothetical protein
VTNFGADRSSPAITRIVVDLPAPLRILCHLTRETGSRAARQPRWRRRLRALSLPGPVRKTIGSPWAATQMGTLCGEPSRLPGHCNRRGVR